MRARNRWPIKSASKRRLKEPRAKGALVKTRKRKVNSKQRLWNLSFEELDARIAARYELDIECPSEFLGIRALLNKASPNFVSDNHLKASIGRLVYSARRLHKDGEYRKVLVDVIQTSHNAQTALGKIYEQMRLIDEDYLEGSLDQVVFSLAPDDKKLFYSVSLDGEDDRVQTLIRLTRLFLQGLSSGLSDLTGSPEKKRERRRPPIPYVMEALGFMNEWESLTGKDVVTPKGRARGTGGEMVGIQPSTEFIRLCLKMIDPEITLSNVHTCIKRAIEFKRKRFAELMEEALGK